MEERKMTVKFSELSYRFVVFAVIATGAGLLFLLSTSDSPAVAVALGAVQEKTLSPFEKPPEDQTYIGTKQCSACHFDQFMTYRATKHAKAFEILPAKYKTDASCLECHSTGFGKPSGYKDASSVGLEGTSCEACHGPGSKHAEIAKEYANKKLSDEESAYVKSSIYKLLPDNSCVKCHQSKAHKPHPAFDKE
jgi:hypothetical protein